MIHHSKILSEEDELSTLIELLKRPSIDPQYIKIIKKLKASKRVV